MTTDKFYRAATQGIEKMNCGSFYTPCDQTAAEYVFNNNEVVYEFDLSVKLFDVTSFMSICDFDLGLSEIFDILQNEDENIDDIFQNFDGFRIDCGHTWLVILFGQIDVKSGKLTKISFDEMIIEDELILIEK